MLCHAEMSREGYQKSEARAGKLHHLEYRISYWRSLWKLFGAKCLKAWRRREKSMHHLVNCQRLHQTQSTQILKQCYWGLPRVQVLNIQEFIWVSHRQNIQRWLSRRWPIDCERAWQQDKEVKEPQGQSTLYRLKAHLQPIRQLRASEGSTHHQRWHIEEGNPLHNQVSPTIFDAAEAWSKGTPKAPEVLPSHLQQPVWKWTCCQLWPMVSAFKWFRPLLKLNQSLKLLSEVSAEGKTRTIEASRLPDLQANLPVSRIDKILWFWLAFPAKLLLLERSKSIMQPVPSPSTPIFLHVTIWL
jgi:hypothetical protein